MRVCFVCLGNICRSPTAEGIFHQLVADTGLGAAVAVDSAGTSAAHVGELADPRSRAEAARRGLALRSRSRQFLSSDFGRFDYVLAMDTSNLRALQRLPGAVSFAGTLTTFLSFDPQSPPNGSVPDPYYGGARGFADVFDLCERTSQHLLAHIRDRHGLHVP